MAVKVQDATAKEAESGYGLWLHIGQRALVCICSNVRQFSRLLRIHSSMGYGEACSHLLRSY